MKMIEQIFRSQIMETLGWTLLHSLWLGLLCYVITAAVLKLIPSKKSDLRYAVSTVGLLSIFVAAGLAFAVTIQMPAVHLTSDESFGNALHLSSLSHHPTVILHETAGPVDTVLALVEANMSFIVLAWGIGVILSVIRIFGGYWYISRIRSGATILGYEWQDKIKVLAEQLDIFRIVTLAESTLIQAPVVMGYIKPMILIPVGMIAGLSTEQVESILIHELIHIRRGDYLVNILQSLLEAIFFFNPFVWALSSAMRREREHCCDDTVVQIYGNPVAYVRALATLEEVRLSRMGVALSLADNKNQLLKRIKRIMEKSVHHHSGREKFVPVVLLILGLMCASWLTSQSKRDSFTNNDSPTLQSMGIVVGDTVTKPNSGHYHKKTIKTIDASGQPQYQIIEEFSDIDEFADVSDIDIDPVPPIEPVELTMDLPEVPESPEVNFDIPEVPEAPEMNFDFSFGLMDTLGPKDFYNGSDWEEFGKAFEERFKEKFEDFYEKHEKDMKDMMKDLEENFNSEHGKLGVLKEEEFARLNAELARVQTEQAGLQAGMAQLDVVKQTANLHAMAALSSNHAELAELQRQVHQNEAWVRDMELEMHQIEKVAQKELVKDGYLKEGEKITNIDISDSGIEINGKKIKSSDEKKYHNMFNSTKRFGGRRE